MPTIQIADKRTLDEVASKLSHKGQYICSRELVGIPYELPYDFIGGSAVVLLDEIHILGSIEDSTAHYKWDGIEWTRVSTLPYKFYNGCAVVLDNEIHILGGTDGLLNHYKYSSKSWVSVSTLPYNFVDGSAVIYQDTIHIIGSSKTSDTKKKRARYNKYTNSWTTITDNTTDSIDFYNGSAVVYDGYIHTLGGGANPKSFRRLVGDTWETETLPDIPAEFSSSSALVLDGKLHVIGGGSDYDSSNLYCVWDGNTWDRIGSIKGNTDTAVVYRDTIYTIGGVGSSSSFIDTSHAREFYRYTSDMNWDDNRIKLSKIDKDSNLFYHNGKINVIKGTSHKDIYGNTISFMLPCNSTLITNGLYLFNIVGDEVQLYKYTLTFTAGTSTYHWTLEKSNILDSTPQYSIYSTDAKVTYSNNHLYLELTLEDHFAPTSSTGIVKRIFDIDTKTLDIINDISANIGYFRIIGLNGKCYGFYYDEESGNTLFVDIEDPDTIICTFYTENLATSNIIVYKDEIHILGGGSAALGFWRYEARRHRKISEGNIVDVSTLPYDFTNGKSVVVDDLIYICGGEYNYTGGGYVTLPVLPGDSTVRYLDTCYVYDPDTNSWEWYHYDYDVYMLPEGVTIDFTYPGRQPHVIGDNLYKIFDTTIGVQKTGIVKIDKSRYVNNNYRII